MSLRNRSISIFFYLIVSSFQLLKFKNVYKYTIMSVYSLKRGFENQADPKLMKCFIELNKHTHVTLKQCE